MRKAISSILSVVMVVVGTGCVIPPLSDSPLSDSPVTVTDIPELDGSTQGADEAMPKVKIQIGCSSFAATLCDNATARALLEKLPLTLDMDDLNANEKYYTFSSALPVSSERVGNIKAGDLMLYGSQYLVLFYKSFSTSYSYTRIGHVEDVSGLSEALGDGSVQVKFCTK